jgi:hypothetical protein
MSSPLGREPTVLSGSFSDFMNQFVEETDRAAVILGAAKIDLLLFQILDKYLLPTPHSEDDLLEGDAPLSTFSARIKACHRLGLVDSQFAKLLNTFRRLRNAFAHEVTHGDLSTGPARDRVAALAEPFADLEYFKRLCAQVGSAMKRPPHDPRVVFRAVLALFHIHLMAIHDDMEGRPTPPDCGIVDFCAAAKVPGSKSSEARGDG